MLSNVFPGGTAMARFLVLAVTAALISTIVFAKLDRKMTLSQARAVTGGEACVNGCLTVWGWYWGTNDCREYSIAQSFTGRVTSNGAGFVRNPAYGSDTTYSRYDFGAYGCSPNVATPVIASCGTERDGPYSEPKHECRCP
jgi:hypothetical protein